MGLYFQNNSLSGINAGRFESPFQWYLEGAKDDNKKKNDIYLQLTHHGLEFYYEVFDNEHPVNTHQKEVILYIPVDDPQKTAYALLNISYPQTGYMISRAGISNYLLGYGDVIPNQEMLELCGRSDGHTFFELLLCFFFDLNNSKSHINKYSHELAEIIKTKLSHCEIYNLILKKYEFYKDKKDYIESEESHAKKKDMIVAYNIYLDEILQEKIKKWVPGSNMGASHWFFTPAEELEFLAKADKANNIDNSRFEDIQKALLAKHDVIKAIRIKTRDPWLPIASHITAFLIYLALFVYWLFGKYNHSIVFISAGLGAFVIGMTAHIIQQRLNIRLLLPRILVSVATAWFVLIVSEDILKNQLNVIPQIVISGFILVLLLLFVFIYAEIRQHSPYYAHSKGHIIANKTMLIIIYSFNVTVSLGLFAHPFVVEPYIEKSKIYQDFIYSSERDSLDIYRTSAINQINKLLGFQNTNNTAFLIINTEELSARMIQREGDTTRDYLAVKRSTEPEIMKIFAETYNKNISSLNISLNDTCLLPGNKGMVSLYQDGGLIKINPNDFDNIKTNRFSIAKTLAQNDSTLTSFIHIFDSLILDLGKKLSIINNHKALMALHTYEQECSNNNKEKKDIHRYNCEIFMGSKSIVYNVFPLMLIFQVSLVLLIAIIGQLIISDKTVTESL